MFRQLTDEQLAIYLAGLFDGEGHLNLKPNRNCELCVIQVELAQNDWPLLNELKEKFGGNVNISGGSGRCWSLALNSLEALTFLTLVFPFLLIKRNEAAVAIEILKLTPSKGKHVSDRDKLVRLRLEQLFEDAKQKREEIATKYSNAEVNSGVRPKPLSTDS